MDVKSIATLEFGKILDRLESYTAFSASAALVRALRPTNDFELARQRQARTTEARRLLSEFPQVNIGGARDVRALVERAARGGVLSALELLDIKATLISSRDLQRFFHKLSIELPHLQAIAADLNPPAGVIEAISRTIDDQAQLLDGASAKLAALRKEVKDANERILSKLEKLINDSSTAAMLQEAIITRRNGRYVVPLRAEFKSRLRCVVQDQSSSGATLFVEPLAIVELNNRCSEAALAEQEEERRILAELSILAGEQVTAIQANVRALAMLDLALACARYADALEAAEPILTEFPDERKADSSKEKPILLRFTHARHPLLDSATVIPIDIALEGNVRALVITGPNTGGKTVSLKTTGLLVLMAQSGLHIPAQSGSQCCVFREVYADIGDEQSIEQSLSTFSGHITNIVRLLKKAGARTLVILDELGAGTDPQEGSALARAILAYLLRRNIPSLIATHYPELKAYAHSTAGAMNASVEFDPRSLRPTYRLLMGLPGRSNALAIAKRLGMEDEILQEAREMIDPSSLRTDDLLDEIQQQMERARRTRGETDLLRQTLEEEKAELEERLEKIEEERLAVMQEARQQALRELETLRVEMEEIRRQASISTPAAKEKKAIRKQITALEERTAEYPERKSEGRDQRRPLKKGERVYLRNLKTDGTLLTLSEESAEVQIGKMRVKVDVSHLERLKNKEGKSVPAQKVVQEAAPAWQRAFQPTAAIELHLRGMRAEEALDRLDKYLDDAFAAGLPFARIVHGKGSGILRQLVREALSASPLVNRWENAMDNEGGEGVTIAHFGD